MLGGDYRSRDRVLGCGSAAVAAQEHILVALDTTEFVRTKMPEWKLQYPGAENLSLAVMGCVVNGPGEARHADVGIAGAPDGTFMLFSKGKALKRVNAEEAVEALIDEVRNFK